MRNNFSNHRNMGTLCQKYIQLLLSINFCLTAVATATGSDAGSDDSFVVIPDPEITKADDTYYADEEHDWKIDMDTHPEVGQDQASNFDPSVELRNQFSHIWHRLKKIHEIYPSELLQRALLQYQDNLEDPVSYDESKPQQDLTHNILVQFTNFYKDGKVSYDESLGEVSKETLEHQFTQLNQFLEVCSQYQPKEELNEESRAKLASHQFNWIKHCLSIIHRIYDSEKESLSKKERAFLRDQLEELCNFFYNFITENSLQLEDLHRFSYDFTAPPSLQTEVGLHSLDRIQALLDSCKEEDSLIYPQYEYIINSQEANMSDLLTSSKTHNAIENQFLYFNKAEGLIEIQHTEDGEHVELYTTT